MPPDGKPLPLIRYRPQASENPLQLRLAHFFLWTAATAVALLLLRPTFPDFPGAVQAEDGARAAQDVKNVLRAGVAVAVAPLYGAALMGFAIGVWRTLRHGPLDVSQPGHWLLLIVGAAFLGGGLLGIVLDGPHNLTQASHYHVLFSGVSLTIALILFVVAPLLLLLAVLEVVQPWQWRVAFRALGAAIAGVCCGCPCAVTLVDVLGVLFLPLLAAPFIALLAAALIDVLQRERRDVAHWLGVLSVVTAVMHLIALALLGV